MTVWQAAVKHGKVEVMPATVKSAIRSSTARSLQISVMGPSMKRSPASHRALAVALGSEIARQGFTLLVTAEAGVSSWAAEGAKTAGGTCIGFSSAVSEREHKKVFGWPVDHFDSLLMTGLDATSRNTLMLRQSDVVIFVCGRTGGLPELDAPLPDKKVVGMVTGSSAVTEEIEHIISLLPEGNAGIVYESQPKKLITRVGQMATSSK